jgi:hypothetical protein
VLVDGVVTGWPLSSRQTHSDNPILLARWPSRTIGCLNRCSGHPRCSTGRVSGALARAAIAARRQRQSAAALSPPHAASVSASTTSAVRTVQTAHPGPSGRVSACQGDLEPVSGFEPLTVRLQGRFRVRWPTAAFLLARGCLPETEREGPCSFRPKTTDTRPTMRRVRLTALLPVKFSTPKNVAKMPTAARIPPTYRRTFP